MILRIFIYSSLLIAAGNPEPRTWRSKDGTKSFEGEFLKREGTIVTITQDGKELTFDMVKLHADDQKWINLYHPIDASKKVGAESTGIIDDLNFGDSHEAVLKKLRKSKNLELIGEQSPQNTVFGYTELNGEYRTKETVGELHAYLHFRWSENDEKLTEISLQSEALPSASYETSLKGCWSGFIELLTALHGPPLQEAHFPSLKQVPAHAIIGSHIWKLEHGGTAMLGTSKVGEQYMVVVHFSQKSVAEIQKSQSKQ